MEYRLELPLERCCAVGTRLKADVFLLALARTRLLHHRGERDGSPHRRRRRHVGQRRPQQRRVPANLVHLDGVEGESVSRRDHRRRVVLLPCLLLSREAHLVDHAAARVGGGQRQTQSNRECVASSQLDELLVAADVDLRRVQRSLERPVAELATVVGAPAERAPRLLAVRDAVRGAAGDVRDVARRQEGNDARRLPLTQTLLFYLRQRVRVLRSPVVHVVRVLSLHQQLHLTNTHSTVRERSACPRQS